VERGNWNLESCERDDGMSELKYNIRTWQKECLNVIMGMRRYARWMG